MDVSKQKNYWYCIEVCSSRSFCLCWAFFLCISLTHSQGINNLWILGYKFSNGTNGNSVLNFDTLPVVPHKVDMQMNFRESNASICDKQGNLLFYTNGVKVMNAKAQVMVNGDSLNPGVYFDGWKTVGFRIGQGQLILPFPDDSNRYYLFHETIEFYGNTARPFHLYYSIIDMSLDSGRGAVTQKNIPILSDTLITGSITASKHANGRDWRLIVHQNKSNLFYKILISPGNGFVTSQQNIGPIWNCGGGGQACFSPNGKRYAHYHQASGLDVFDFDRCTGTFSNWQHTDSLSGYGGVAFSANSKILYVTTDFNAYQFNLSDTTQTLTDLRYKIAQWDSSYIPGPPFAASFYLAQLAPDERIYVSCGNGVPVLHVIHQPDSLGLACNFAQHAINLPTVNGTTIPNHPNYFLGADSGSVCDTLQLAVKEAVPSQDAFGIFVQPNPANAYFSVGNLDDNSQLSIYNAQGRLVFATSINASTTSIHTANWSSGLYSIRIQNPNGIKTKKLLVLH